MVESIQVEMNQMIPPKYVHIQVKLKDIISLDKDQ